MELKTALTITARLRPCNLLRSIGIRAFHARQKSGQNDTSSTEKPVSSREAYNSASYFKSNVLLAKYLHQNILYENLTNKDKSKAGKRRPKLIVINKPYGVPSKIGGKNGYEDGTQGSQLVSLDKALPLLKDLVPEVSGPDWCLNIVKSPGRYCSGPLIVEVRKGEVTPSDRIAVLRKMTKTSRAFHEKYLVLTRGSPIKDASEECADLRLEKGNRKGLKGGTGYEPVIFRELFGVKDWWKSKLDKELKEIKRFSVKTETLAKSEGDVGALVSVEPTTTAWNFIPVYMAEMLSPIIGDVIFSYRVQTVMNKRVKVSHKNGPAAYDDARLSTPPALLRKLGLSPREQELLPLHVHLFRTSILNFFGRGQHLTVHAPPPAHFAHSCHSLHIPLDFDDLVGKDEISYKKYKHNKAKKLQGEPHQETPE